ncbi:MAG TPA: TIGR03960 family B12-binding radical SAM protein, partial [Spirochaetia bacterium]|nr:TIGR03960 family B12-binding radical SAM protein [Spirochaetia bacterium]
MKATTRIHPLSDLGERLLSVEKPARYLGGELGSVPREGGEGGLLVALSFPDLYEIGMSNNAIRILYGGLNAVPGVRCERVFAPAPDFEALLKEKGIPLYTLEGGRPLREADILGFSVGYELAATSILAILDSGRVPLDAADRGEDDPIVIAGGPAISNPHPFARFLDAAFIGEAEGSFFEVAGELAAMKKAGAGRSALLARLAEEKAVWMPKGRGAPAGAAGSVAAVGQDAGSGAAGEGKKALRAVYSGFSSTVYRTARPLPTVKAVQDHGTVEIMRGCPNGCRFCHAGYYYRPQRMKPYEVVRAEVEALVREGGHREITLASLSSGDYAGIGELLAALNKEWAGQGLSFQLPSLKVNSFTLPLIEALSEVRKSGLTFAVETPVDAWQRILNKDVSFERTVEILTEAKARGFKLAKFYFMMGLPVPGRGKGEAEAIVDFFDRLALRVPMQLNVNVGVFVPKPHTPFQWSGQLGEDEALEAIQVLRAGLRRHKGIKLSYHSPFVSLLEGVISRGDERVGGLLLEAWRRGARLDAWEERFDRELWRSVFNEAGWDVLGTTLSERGLDEALPWDDVLVRVSKASFKEEYRRALAGDLTSLCAEKCDHACGSCSDEAELVLNSEHIEAIQAAKVRGPATPKGRLVFRFSKSGVATFFQHLGIVEAFERAFTMLDLPAAYSEGFNPMPRFEVAQPLPIRVSSSGEIASLLVSVTDDEPLGSFKTLESLVEALNGCLPEGLRVEEVRRYPQKVQAKIHSLGG